MVGSETNPINFTENFVLSGIAALISKTTAAPAERIKILLQNQNELIKQGIITEPYAGIRNCAARVYRKDGFWSFWRGNWANCVRYIPTQAMNFALKDHIKSFFPTGKTATNFQKLSRNTMAGGVAGALTLTVVYPLDFARNRLGADVRNAQGQQLYSGLIDVYRKIIKTDGLLGLYRGFSLGVIGIFIYRAIYFGFYDTLKPMWEEQMGISVGFFQSFALAYVITICAAVIPYPTDTLRRRMMMTSGTGNYYTSSYSAGKQIILNEGFLTLYKGWSANVLRSIAGGLVLASADLLKQYYKNMKVMYM